jgi:GTPase SAR1 family protein
VYDVTDGSTFDSVRAWMSQIKMHAESGVNVLLVGNKLDLAEQHRVCIFSPSVQHGYVLIVCEGYVYVLLVFI